MFGVLDERRRKGWLNENEFAKSLENFASETVRLLHLKTLEVFPILNPIIVKIKPKTGVSTRRVLVSAFAGPLVPFLIGLIIYHIDTVENLSLFGLYFPFLMHILILPFDIVGALGFELE